MKIFTLLLVLLLLCPSTVLAEASEERSPFIASVRGLANFEDYLPIDGIARQKALKKSLPANLQLILFIPGQGRTKIKFNEIRSREVLPHFSDGVQTWPDPQGITLLRGLAKTENGDIPVAGSIYRINNKPNLFVSFQQNNSRGTRNRYFKIKIPLISEELHTGQVTRVSKYTLHSKQCQGASLVTPAASDPVLHTEAALSVSAVKIVDLALYGDNTWAASHGSSANSAISAYVNEAETIYENQLDLTYEVKYQTVLTAKSFGTSNAENKLAAFRQSVTVGNIAGFGTGDGYHLFTGDDLTGSTIGLAYQINDQHLGAICRFGNEYTFGISQNTNSALTPLTFAHELGHNISAIHPEEDKSTFPYPPNPSIMTGIAPANPSDSQVRKFSNYSVNQIATYVSGFGSCLAESDSGDGGGDDGGGDDGGGDDGGGDDGSGGGGGDAGGDGNAVPVSLSLSLGSSGLFTATISITDARPTCNFRLRGSTRKSKVSHGKILVTVAADQVSKGLQATLTRKTSRFNKRGRRYKVFVAAEISCSDNSSEISSPVRIKPNRIKSSKPRLTPSKWLNKLSNKLEKSLS